MDLIDKAGKGVGDLVAKARERERVRLEDRLRLLDTVETEAREMVGLLKHRPGYTWDTQADAHGLRMISAAEAIDDDALRTAVDELYAIDISRSRETARTKRGEETTALQLGFRAVVSRLGQVRRETLADD